MSEFVYPGNELEDGRALLDAIGSFWSSMYGGRDLVEDIFFCVGQQEQQVFRDFKEAARCTSRLLTPIYHLEHWYSIVTLKSTLGTRLLQYGDGAVYGNQPDTGILYQYGGKLNTPYYLVKKPDEMVSCPMIQNRMTDPSIVWVLGVDYTITHDGYFAFSQNPFETGMFATRDVVDEAGNVVDQELMLWCYYSQWEMYYMRDHWGWLINLELPSSKYYSDMVNAVLDASVLGTADENIERIMEANTGIELCDTDSETVERIVNHNDELVIVTDVNVYRYKDTSEAIVNVGDVLQAGDPLVDSMIFYDLNRGQVPPDLMGISMGTGMMSEGFIEGVTFRNQTVPTVVTTEQGHTKISWELGGFPSDVDHFWDEVHRRGIESGQTLAQLMDTRGPDAPTEPSAATLPTTINPLEFLIQNVLRFNAYAVRVKVEDAYDTGVDATRALRKTAPPWVAIIFIYEMEFDDDSLIMDGVQEGDEPAYSEEFTTLDGMEKQTEDVAPATFLSESFLINEVTIACR